MVSACLEAYRSIRHNAPSTGSSGGTIPGLELYSSDSGACSDGLHVDRVNENQGAESTLAFLLSLVEMRLGCHGHPRSFDQVSSVRDADAQFPLRPLHTQSYCSDCDNRRITRHYSIAFGHSSLGRPSICSGKHYGRIAQNVSCRGWYRISGGGGFYDPRRRYAWRQHYDS